MTKEIYDLQEQHQVLNTNMAKQNHSTLKIISWILAYAVWIFIFLIPVVGIILIVMFLLKNQLKSDAKKAGP